MFTAACIDFSLYVDERWTVTASLFNMCEDFWCWVVVHKCITRHAPDMNVTEGRGAAIAAGCLAATLHPQNNCLC